MTNRDLQRGVLYIAFGDQWVAETKRSIRSLRSVSSLAVAVITDIPWSGPDQPDEWVVHEAIPGFASKPKLMGLTPFEKTLFIDTDTFVAQDVSPVFGLLTHYDMGVHFFGPMLKVEPDLYCHPQCSSGVILYKKNQHVSDVYRLWNEEYEAATQIRQATDSRGVGNQRYLAIAIARSAARVVHLGTYMNFMLIEPLTTQSPVMILHGRVPHIGRVADEFNRNWDVKADWHPRLWLPNIRGLLPAGLRHSDPILASALIVRRLFNDIRRFLSSLRKERRS